MFKQSENLSPAQQLVLAWDTAVRYHAEDYDKAGKPVLHHVRRVFWKCVQAHGLDSPEACAALLHDVIEDHHSEFGAGYGDEYEPQDVVATAVTRASLVGTAPIISCLNRLKLMGFDVMVREAVAYLTRLPNETYSDYIDRLSVSKIATNVKVFDLQDNLSRDFDGDKTLKNRYIKALLKLLEEQHFAAHVMGGEDSEDDFSVLADFDGC